MVEFYLEVDGINVTYNMATTSYNDSVLFNCGCILGACQHIAFLSQYNK